MPRLGSGIPLIGRSDELMRLGSALDRAASGVAGGVLLSGDAGVGKSRLVAELGTRAREMGALVVTGRCTDMAEGALPYLPFSEALASLAATHSPELEQVVQQRPALEWLLPQRAATIPAVVPVGPEGTPLAVDHENAGRTNVEQDIGQLQLFDAVRSALTELAAARPVVLVVEDLHWADASTRDMLAFLLARLRSQRLLVVVTYRHDDVHRRHPLRTLLAELARTATVERIELPALTEDDARAFVDAIGEGQLSADAARGIVRRAEGNPFLLEELVAAGAGDGHELPAELAEVLLARLERLPQAVRRLLRTVSVAHGAVAHSALADVAGNDELELEDALREAVQHNVLVVDGRYYAFRHSLLREAVYTDLLPGERARLHAAYAHRLVGMRQRGVAAQLAYHSLESNDLPTALAASLRAAEEAQSVGAPASVLRHLERALRIWHAVPPPERPAAANELELTRRASRAAGAAGEPDRSISYARAAVELLASGPWEGDAEEAATTYLRLARALLGLTGSLAEAASVIDRAWQLVIDAPASHTRTWVLAVRARILRGLGNDDEALGSAHTALAEARAGGFGGAEADALITIGRLAEKAGTPPAAREHLCLARDRAREAGAIGTELMARYFLGLSYDEQGELNDALATYDEAVARAEAAGTALNGHAVESRVRQLHLRYVRGEWAGLDTAEPVRSALPEIAAALLAGPIAHAAVAQGHFADAGRLMAEMRPYVGTELLIAIAAAAVGAEMACWQGDHEEGLRWARTGLDRCDGPGPGLLAVIRIAAHGIASAVGVAAEARREGDREREDAAIGTGEDLLDRARASMSAPSHATRQIGPEAIAWLARAEAEASRLRGGGSPELWREAARAFDYGAVYDQAVCRWRQAEALLVTVGQRDAGPAVAELLADAHATAEHLGAAPLRDAVAATAARARAARGNGQVSRHPAVANPLTERELAVLELVALGRTNRQIGEQLYISEKTVSVHLSRTMAKLGASRRAEAVAIAYDRALLSGPSEPDSQVSGERGATP
ncbi:AAA family ATPase [Haloechinothrix sp. LS1_15]|uniref:helix-turn-helix transcriptional regulator n=1 Tax=Haloechinothrix sp. LS1_15 TaxID=2652248 RepID=UPI0029483C77|nr:AAA family ATPase [Haloechinothrix sp. LS1_15]MDV6012925.1 AAA family ATPase [Haloechinothrix sp. LS1_15]